MTSDKTSRPYRKQKRALREQETRQRITEAAVHLHGTVGPANTSVTDVAKLARVSRMTVYSHFPTEVDLFTACSTHWATQNPFPTIDAWTAIEDPAQRLVVALTELYHWYGLKREMLGNVLRDAAIVASLGTVMERFWSPYMDSIVESLAVGWPLDSTDELDVQAALGLAVSFDTWQRLTEPGLDDQRAASLATRMVVTGVRASQQ